MLYTMFRSLSFFFFQEKKQFIVRAFAVVCYFLDALEVLKWLDLAALLVVEAYNMCATIYERLSSIAARRTNWGRAREHLLRAKGVKCQHVLNND